MQIAIIDLGTNTFNLLIAETQGSSYKILVETKYPAKLGKGGIHKKQIAPDAFERGIVALKTHQQTIASYKVEKTYCFATSAIRDAENGQEFVQFVKDNLGLEIRIIDGQKEAQLIFDGVKQVVPIGDENVMILDIGGGSNEFVIANKNGVLWKHSFNLGVSRLLELFHPADPISGDDINKLENHFITELSILYDAVKIHQPKQLIGSSGSFDTLVSMIALEHHPLLDVMQIASYEIDLKHLAELHQKYLSSTIAERMQMKGLDQARVELIVIASLFIQFVIREFAIQRITQCTFALKEGAIYQALRNQL